MKKLLLLFLLLLSLAAVAKGGWIHAKAILAKYLIADAWEQRLEGVSKPKPWPWADTWPVARLQVPELGVDQFVLAGASGRTLAFGPGHVPGSAFPGGQGSAVISGHRDTHFRWLRKLQKGDVLVVQRPDGQHLSYRVEQLAVVDETDTSILQVSDQPVLHLLTCYPFDALIPGGPLRYVVTAEALPGTESI